MGLIACLITPLTLGMEVIALDPFRWVLKPQKLFDAIEEHCGTHVWMPNFAFLHLVRAVRAGKRQWDLSSVEAFINCSEPCTPNAFDAFAERWRDHGVRPETLTCCYAMAETVFAVSQTVPGVPALRVSVVADGYGTIGQPVRLAAEGAPAMHLLSCGAPLDGVAVRLVDDAGAPVADGCYGQIQVSAPFLFSGYYGAPERTATVLTDGWYRTGDIGMVMDGEVFVCGRIDDMIIVNGRNLYAHEIEKVVASVDGVLPGRVVAFPHFAEEVGSNQLVVVAESDITDEDARLDLGTAISGEIMTAVGVLPAEVRIVPRKTILKTTSGKVDRRSNMLRYAEGNLVVWGP
jgi:acyl-CoA synthetase (AMP-forming)/AMP-acid ligase II